jgi:uncharacterized protein YkuJ
MVLSQNYIYMSRLKQNRIIDNAIKSVASITQSQCSLSESDLIVVNEVLERLQFLKRKKGKTNEQIRDEIAKVVVLLIEFFAKEQIVETKMPNDNPNTP